MGTNCGGIDEQLRRRPNRIGQGMEYLAPDTLASPALEAVVERLPRAVDGRGIDPASTALDDMDDAADHAPVIHARLAASVGRKMRSQLRELHVRQPEMVSIHHSPPFGEGESHQANSGNPFMGPDPSTLIVVAMEVFRLLVANGNGGRPAANAHSLP